MIFLRLTGCIFAAAAMCTVPNIGARAAGAFAVGNCGAYGFSYDYAEAEAAKRAAVAQCDGACTSVPVMRACAALAIDAGKSCGAYGYATARKLGAAQNTALKECYGHGGKDCMIRAWICDAKG